jgi:hypothetical protein
MPSEVEQRPRHEPLYDINPRTGVSIEVFYADRALETFDGCGVGWFYWARRRGFSPVLQKPALTGGSYANRSPCYLANIRVIFGKNSELAAESAKNACSAVIF